MTYEKTLRKKTLKERERIRTKRSEIAMAKPVGYGGKAPTPFTHFVPRTKKTLSVVRLSGEKKNTLRERGIVSLARSRRRRAIGHLSGSDIASRPFNL